MTAVRCCRKRALNMSNKETTQFYKGQKHFSNSAFIKTKERNEKDVN